MRVLFVCTGNICRSPTAEAVFQAKAQNLGLPYVADSAGTSAEETGNPPHRQSTAVLRRRGFVMPERVARRVRAEDFQTFDLLVGMDRRHVRTLRQLAPPDCMARIDLLMAFVKDPPVMDVPDPWYGNDEGFEDVFDLIENGVDALIADLRNR